ncbi:MAG: phosphoribosyltransferase family protein [Thermoguttaceae bacterium]
MSRFWRNVRGLWTAGLGLLFPPRCVSCGEEMLPGPFGSEAPVPLCNGCLAIFGPADWNGCWRCGTKLSGELPLADGCPRCRKTRLHFDTVVALGGYHTGLRDAVLRMKRPAHEPLSYTLGQLLAERHGERLAEIDANLIVPIPMFWRRRLGRGVNSPEVLARCLGQSLATPVRPRLLVRCRNTAPQGHLTPARRLENVRGAFHVRRPDAVQNARILLVDDVLTTGATCGEAAKMLKKAGAAMVAVAVVARA